MSTTAQDTSVWSSLVGQHHAIEVLKRAVAGQGMTHAWLFTGPPGSGRSNAAIAFAAALQCERGGCGVCEACRTTLAGSHPDVSITRTDQRTIGVSEARELVRASALHPTGRRWQVMVVEDADRLTEQANNALLKAIEEPTARTIWLLCAPTPEDVLTTIRSRSRNVVLSTPTAQEVADFLVQRVGVAEPLAAHAARASQGHIGRARALALDEATRNRRRDVVTLPGGLKSLGDCMNAAANLVDIAKDETSAITEQSNARELADLGALYGSDAKARSSRTYKAAMRELADTQKARQKRREMDVIDRCLMDLMSVYRDAIAVQTGAAGALVNEEMRAGVEDLARRSSAEDNLRRIDAIFAAREQMMEFNTTPLLALESMMVKLRTR
ncbi:MAG: DNA polymerase III subunit delta' [Nocardioidaceae bacterium]